MKKYTKAIIVICIIYTNTPIFSQSSDTIENHFLQMTVGYTGIQDSLYVTPNYNPLIGEREFIDNTIWAPGNTYGTIPYDIIGFVDDNKVYVYGDRQILVIDASENTVDDQIDISKYSNTSMDRLLTPGNQAETRMAKKEGVSNMLYVVTEDLRLIAINTADNGIIGTSEQVANPHDYWTNVHLKYDKRNDKLYLMINYPFSSHLYIYDAQSLIYEHDITFQTKVYSWLIYPNRDVFCISSDDKLLFYRSNSYEKYKETICGNNFGTMVYVSDSFDGIAEEKIYCFPWFGDNIKVLDADTDEVAFSISTTRHGYKQATYNKSQQRVYAIYQSSYTPGYATINAWDDNNCAEHDVSITGHFIDCLAFGNKTIITSSRGLYYVGATGSPLNTIELGGFASIKNKIYLFEEHHTAYVTNLRRPEVIKLDINCEITARINTGAFNTYGLSASASNNIYFYATGYEAWTALYKYNTIQEEFTVIELGFAVSAITYSEFYDAIYVCGYNNETNTTSIKKIDCVTNNIVNIDINFPECSGLFCTPDNKLYISVRDHIGSALHHILIYDLDTQQIESDEDQILYSDRRYTDFEFDPVTNKMFVAISMLNVQSAGGVFCFANHSYEEYYEVESPAKIKYNPLENKVYVLHRDLFYDNHYISVFNLEEETVSEIYLPENDIPIDIEIGLPNNNLYVTKYHNHSSIEVLDCSSDEFGNPINVDGVARSLQFNSINNKLYVFTPWDFADNNQMKISGINLNTNEVNAIELDIYQANHPLGLEDEYNFSSYVNSMVITSDNNLYLPTSQHSNIIKIKCDDDAIGLWTKWFNWVSYPRLQRPDNNPDVDAPVNTENFLSNMYPFPDRLDQYGKNPNDDGPLTHIRYENNAWENIDLENIYSSRGYKIQTSNTGSTYIPMTGTRLAPDHEITLYPGREKENWVGYFVPYPQNPLEALSYVLPDMVMARGYDWTIADIGGSMEPVWQLIPEDAVIKYGEMAIIETSAQKTFQWFSGKQEIEKQTNNPENFLYEEKADYTAFIIEPDTSNPPLEIGAFVNDTCVGACVVEPGDSLVLLRGYMPIGEGDSVVFESYYGSRSANNQRLDGYYVFNKDKNRKEKRAIKTGENKRFYLVSFNNKEEQEKSIESFVIHVYPNPTTGMLNIELENFSDYKGSVIISVIDPFGRKLFDTSGNNIFPGMNVFQLKFSNEAGISLKPGIYLLKVLVNDQTLTKKIIVK